MNRTIIDFSPNAFSMRGTRAMKTIIITQSGTHYALRNGWLTDGKADYKFHCRLGPNGFPYFNQDIKVGDQLTALLPDNSALVTSPVVAILNERS